MSGPEREWEILGVKGKQERGVHWWFEKANGQQREGLSPHTWVLHQNIRVKELFSGMMASMLYPF